MSFLMGIDIGTSGTKTVIADENGKLIGSSVREYPLYQEKSGWAEQEPGDWWKAVCETSMEAISKSSVDPKDIKAVGLTGQMHGAVLLDRNGEVLRRAIIWCDQRSSEECSFITSVIGSKRLIEITANPALTGFTASKLIWVRMHEKEIYDRIKKLLLPKDYIRFRLTGAYATDVSDASGMQFMDIPKRKWSSEILNGLDIDENILPVLYESPEITGEITKEASEHTGLLKGTPVAGGAGDQAAGAIGNGIVEPGIVSATIGTSGVVFAYSDSVKIDPLGRVHTFCHAVPGKYHIMGVTQGAGLSLKWFRDNFCIEEKRTAELLEVDPYELIVNEAAKARQGSEGLIYLPYLMGERTPHLDPLARGVFFGLTSRHGKREIVRSIMEGVVYSLKDCLDIIEGMSGPASEVRASGGGAGSGLWRQMLSDIFDRDICVVLDSAGPALGAAVLAGTGAGIYRTVAEGCKAAVRSRKTNTPEKTGHEIYMKYYGIYRSLYPVLKDLFSDISKI